MRNKLNGYGGIFLGLFLFGWVGYNYFLDTTSHAMGKNPLFALALASVLLGLGIAKLKDIKATKQQYTILYVITTLMFIGITIVTWYQSRVTVFTLFMMLLLLAVGLIMWHKIELKRFFRLLLLPPLLMIVPIIFIIEFTQESSVDLAYSMEVVFGLLGGVLFGTVFFMYVLFPVLILFALAILLIEKFFDVHYRLLILISPFIAMFLMISIQAYKSGVEKMFDLGSLYVAVLVAFPMAVAIEEYLYHHKKDARTGA